MSPSPPTRTYTISDSAYETAVLHATKYVTAVHGLLLAPPSTSGNAVHLSQAIPIAHSALACLTSPTTETAIHLARSHAQLCDLQIAGVYYAPELADDDDIPALPTRLADLVRRDGDAACLLVLEARKLHPRVRAENHCFRLFTLEGESARAGSWAKGRRDAAGLAVSNRALRACDEKLGDGESAAQGVVDFEDHCLNPGLVWLPPHLPSSPSQ